MESLTEKLKCAIVEYVAKEANGSMAVDGWKVSRASRNGDSFAADVLRISVPVHKRDENHNDTLDGTQFDEVKLIAKVAPKLKFRREMYSIPILFEREMFMYTTLLPDLKQFQVSRLGPLSIKLFDNYPRLIGTSNDPYEEFVLLSDICDEGFVNFDRTQGAELNACKEIFSCFARFHAISFAYQAVDNKRFMEVLGDNLRETLFVKALPEGFAEFLRTKADLVQEKLIKCCTPEPIDERVIERLKAFRRECIDDMHEACHVQDYAVVCHGDSWISNFMYKVNADKSLDVKILDFQVGRFTTPIVDLSYFLACSTDKDVRKNLPELLMHYYNSLMDEILHLGITTPTELYPYEVFRSQCKKYLKFGFGMACLSLHSITCQPADMPDVIGLLETSSYEKMNDYMEFLGTNPAYVKRITELARDLVEYGYL